MAVLTTAVAALGGKTAVKGAVVKSLGGLFKSALGSNLKGFFKNGLAFSCLGNQAFNNKDYNDFTQRVQQWQQEANAAGTEEALADFFTKMSLEVNAGRTNISNYRSKCSKQLMEQHVSNCQQLLDMAGSFGFRAVGTKTVSSWMGVDNVSGTVFKLDENSEAYLAEERKHLPVVTPPVEPVGEPTSDLFEDLEGLDTEIGDDLTNYLVEGETVTPTRSSGNIRVGVEGDGFEGTLATGRYANQNNTFLYLLVGFGIMYFLTKKR